MHLWSKLLLQSSRKFQRSRRMGAVNREDTLIYGTQQCEGAIALEPTPHS